MTALEAAEEALDRTGLIEWRDTRKAASAQVEGPSEAMEDRGGMA